MLKINNPITSYISFLISLISITAGVHFLILNKLDLPLFENNIISAYIVNATIALFIYIILYILRKNQEANIGFIFMFGSLIKIVIFFLFFYPAYKLDGKIQTLEFTTYFIPYTICLIISTFFLTKLLNK